MQYLKQLKRLEILSFFDDLLISLNPRIFVNEEVQKSEWFIDVISNLRC